MMSRLEEIQDIGRDSLRGGYSRHLFEEPELELRRWFQLSAEQLGLQVELDGNGNLWAWYGEPGPGAIVTGSHLDSVPGGGAYDGPLGVVSALEAIEILQTDGWRPSRPVAICVFAEEEGSRFGVPCLGSRLMVGEISPDDALSRSDRSGVTMRSAWHQAALDVSRVGADLERLERIGAFIELHVEQGVDLEERDLPLAAASTIIPHGRWRLTITGEGNHAGSTPMEYRRDPVVAASAAVLAIKEVAERSRKGARATVGKMSITPNGTNVIASLVDLWVDIRADTDEAVREQLAETVAVVEQSTGAQGCELKVLEESFTPTVRFDRQITTRIIEMLDGIPAISTGAGHDAGVLSAYVPSAMLFVRNPTGVSHAPGEGARSEDCERGARALALVLKNLAEESPR